MAEPTPEAALALLERRARQGCQSSSALNEVLVALDVLRALAAENERLRKPDLRMIYGYELGESEAAAERDALATRLDRRPGRATPQSATTASAMIRAWAAYLPPQPAVSPDREALREAIAAALGTNMALRKSPAEIADGLLSGWVDAQEQLQDERDALAAKVAALEAQNERLRGSQLRGAEALRRERNEARAERDALAAKVAAVEALCDMHDALHDLGTVPIADLRAIFDTPEGEQ